MRNVKVCISFEKDHMSALNIGWDGVRDYLSIKYQYIIANYCPSKGSYLYSGKVWQVASLAKLLFLSIW